MVCSGIGYVLAMPLINNYLPQESDYTHHCVILKNGIFALKPLTVVMVLLLYESKVLLVSLYAFAPQMSGL